MKKLLIAVCVTIIAGMATLWAADAPKDDAAKQQRMDRLYARAVSCEANQRYLDADYCYRNIVSLDEKYKDAAKRARRSTEQKLVNLGFTLTRASQMKPNEAANLYSYVGSVYLSNGWLNKSRAMFEAARKADPENMNAVINLMYLSFIEGNKDECAALLKTYEEKAKGPNVQQVLRAFKSLQAQVAGDWKTALEQLTPADAKAPLSPRLAMTLYFFSKKNNAENKALLENVQMQGGLEGGWLGSCLKAFQSGECDYATVKRTAKSSIKMIPPPNVPAGMTKETFYTLADCDTGTFLGFFALLKGDEANAKELLTQALSSGLFTKTEYLLALIELRRLNAVPAKLPGHDVESDFPNAAYVPKNEADAPAFDLGADKDSPYAKMKVGDWAIYKIPAAESNYVETVQLDEPGKDVVNATVTVRLGAIFFPPEKTVKMTAPLKIKEKALPDWLLSKEEAKMLMGRLNPNDPKVTKLPDEEIAIASGKKLACKVYEMEDANGNLTRNWYSDAAPFDGLVKIAFRNFEICTLTQFGAKGDAIPGGKELPKTKYYSPYATPAQLTPELEKTIAQTSAELKAFAPEKALSAILNFQIKKTTTFDEMMKDCGNARVIYVAEEPSAPECHKMELEVVKALTLKKCELTVGLEIFDRDGRTLGALAAYVDGKIDAETLQAEIFTTTAPPPTYDLYQNLLSYAKESNVKLLGLVGPADKKYQFLLDPKRLFAQHRGLYAHSSGLTDEQHKRIVMWYATPELRKSQDQFDFAYKAFCLDDDTMAETVVGYLKANPNAKLVVVLSAMHGMYRVTVPERAAALAKTHKVDYSYKVIAPHPLATPPDFAVDELLKLDLADYYYFYKQAAPAQPAEKK